MRLVRGATGPIVADVQRSLVKRGFDLLMDGVYENLTFRAVKMFQVTQGLAPTGVINGVTWKLLQASNDIAEEKILGAESPSNVGVIIDGLQPTSLAAVAMDLQAAAITYDIKLGFLAALAGVESGWGRSQPFRAHRNIFGLLDADDRVSLKTYETYRAGIDDMAVRLIEQFLLTGAPWFMGGTLSGLSVYGVSSNAEFEDGTLWIRAVGEAWGELRKGHGRKRAPYL